MIGQLNITIDRPTTPTTAAVDDDIRLLFCYWPQQGQSEVATAAATP